MVPLEVINLSSSPIKGVPADSVLAVSTNTLDRQSDSFQVTLQKKERKEKKMPEKILLDVLLWLKLEVI